MHQALQAPSLQPARTQTFAWLWSSRRRLKRKRRGWGSRRKRIWRGYCSYHLQTSNKGKREFLVRLRQTNDIVTCNKSRRNHCTSFYPFSLCSLLCNYKIVPYRFFAHAVSNSLPPVFSNCCFWEDVWHTPLFNVFPSQWLIWILQKTNSHDLFNTSTIFDSKKMITISTDYFQMVVLWYFCIYITMAMV